jgi:hypothetical protein
MIQGYHPANGRANTAHGQIYTHPQFQTATPAPRQGYAELDAETPGRYRRFNNDDEKAVLSARMRYDGHEDIDMDENTGMRSPPPAYRE